LIQVPEHSLHASARFALKGRSSGKHASSHWGITRERTARALPQNKQGPPGMGERRDQFTRVGER
jgi:hypothetical protein